MYFELTAPSQVAYKMAIWDAELIGLDPMEMGTLTFNIGTGSIEKVSRLRDKYNLTESYMSDYESTGYQEKQMSEYSEGFQDGYKFGREELMEKLREIDISDIDSWLLDRLADMIEGNQL